jgi:hypothetical protein
MKRNDDLEGLSLCEDYINRDLKGNRLEVCELHSSGPGWGQAADYCERGSETSGSINGGEFLEYLSVKLASQEGF